MIRKLFLISDFICLVVAIAIGLDYSYYVANIKYVNDTKTVILADTITLNCEDKEIKINNETLKETYQKEFEVSNLSDQDSTFNIILNSVTNTYGNDLIYELYNEDKILVSKTIAPTNGNSYIKLNLELKAAETKKYKIVFTLKNSQPEEYYNDKVFNAILQINTININSEIKTATNYLIATNSLENGLYKMQDADKTIYYYKGDVVNNYVSFNGELWRIVRINEDGSIKIVKNDNINENIKFYDDSKEDNANSYSSSNIKSKLNIYYNETLKQYESMLMQEDYCTNINVVRNDNYKTTEMDKNTKEFNPVVSCNDQNKSLVGILSYNDAILSGLTYNSQTSSYLLKTDNPNTWLTTNAGANNYNNDKYIWYLDRNSVKDTVVTNENSIRPVINLKATLNIQGSGTMEDPYTFSE